MSRIYPVNTVNPVILSTLVAKLDLEAGGHAVEGFAVDAEDFGSALAVVAGGVQDKKDVAALDLV